MILAAMLRVKTAMLSTFLALALGACGGPVLPADQGGGAMLTEPHPELMKASGWLEFADLSLHTAAQSDPPLEPFVRGLISGSRFYPAGPIVGSKERPLGRRGRVLINGWLDLQTRAFYPTSSEHKRTVPYVTGIQDQKDGGFYPLEEIVTASAQSN